MSTNNNDRLAVLIDADNAQAAVVPELLVETFYGFKCHDLSNEAVGQGRLNRVTRKKRGKSFRPGRSKLYLFAPGKEKHRTGFKTPCL